LRKKEKYFWTSLAGGQNLKVIEPKREKKFRKKMQKKIRNNFFPVKKVQN